MAFQKVARTRSSVGFKGSPYHAYVKPVTVKHKHGNTIDITIIFHKRGIDELAAQGIYLQEKNIDLLYDPDTKEIGIRLNPNGDYRVGVRGQHNIPTITSKDLSQFIAESGYYNIRTLKSHDLKKLITLEGLIVLSPVKESTTSMNQVKD